MAQQVSRQLVTGVALLVLLLAVPALAGAQAIFNPKDWDGKLGPGARSWIAERAKLPPYTAPRTKDGQPDLQGRWGGTWSGDDIEEIPKFLDITTPPWESYVSDPANGKIPYQPWAMAERIAHREGLGREAWSKDPTKRLYYDPQAFCMKNVPRYSERGYELVQTRDTVIMMLNWGHIYRVIPLDSQPRPSNAIRMWMGSARGHFEGDTLVVETTNLNGKMWLDSGGNFIGPNAKVTERIRLVSANDLDYQATIDDPETFTQPWTLTARQRRQGAGGGQGGGNAVRDPYAAESWEHACHEGNGEHEDDIRKLGFKWYLPPAPPRK
jgi:hypothetical protein